MTDKETVKRIKEEANNYIVRGGEWPMLEYSAAKVYIAGAISERNKVLDEAIERITKEWNNYATLNDIIRTLESLKL